MTEVKTWRQASEGCEGSRDRLVLLHLESGHREREQEVGPDYETSFLGWRNGSVIKAKLITKISLPILLNHGFFFFFWSQILVLKFAFEGSFT